MHITEKLIKLYRKRKQEIESRLREFRKVRNRSEKDVFSELCFCILTPQSSAHTCGCIIKKMQDSRILFSGTPGQIRPYLKNARFYKNKTKYLIEARRMFSRNGRISIKNRLDIENIEQTREWLVKNVKGIGYKEASHFLRNIGLGENLAILDIHILRKLKETGVIRDIPKTLTRKKYLEIEKKLRGFSGKIKIPVSHLDLLFWSAETGNIYK